MPSHRLFRFSLILLAVLALSWQQAGAQRSMSRLTGGGSSRMSASSSSSSSSRSSSSSSSSSKKIVIGPSYAWKVLPPLGLREPSTIDTLYLNYAERSVPSFASPAYATTGNFGGPGQTMIWMDREPMSPFFFSDAVRHWTPSLSKMTFYNTRVPMTLVTYNTAGSRINTQDQFSATFSGNVNPRAQIGAMFEYLYSKGSYDKQAAKDIIAGVSGSYMGDHIEFQGFLNHYDVLFKENGGITDDLYITDPAQLQGGNGTIDSKSIPVNLANAHSRVKDLNLYLNTRYKLGFWREESPSDTIPLEDVPDSLRVHKFVPVSAITWTLDLHNGSHMFRDNPSSGDKKDFFKNSYITTGDMEDLTHYSSIRNTIGLSLLEGFNRYAQAGLSAYVAHEYHHIRQTTDTILRLPFEERPQGVTDYEGTLPASKASENGFFVGAQLIRAKGRIINYDATAELGLTSRWAGDLKVDGNLYTRFRLGRDSVAVRANVMFRNQAAPYLMDNYISNHFIWHNSFSKTRRLRLGGEITLPFTRTRIGAAVENVQNLIYFNEECLPVQHGGNVQIVSAVVRQNLAFRALHWDNTVIFQKSSDSGVIPLPSLALNSNLYVTFKVARVLSVQLGVNCDYYTRYYGVDYQPATMSFYNQRSIKVGNYPFMNAYANFKLSRTRFFIMMSHVNQGIIGGDDYFSVPHYPLNPRRFQMGLSVDFAN